MNAETGSGEIIRYFKGQTQASGSFYLSLLFQFYAFVAGFMYVKKVMKGCVLILKRAGNTQLKRF